MTMIAPQKTKGVHTKPIHLLDPSIYCDYSPITNWGTRRPFNTRTNRKGESSIEWTTLAPARKTGFEAVQRLVSRYR